MDTHPELFRKESNANISLHKYNPRVDIHVKSHASNTPESQTGNLLHPLTKYHPNQTIPKILAEQPAIS